MKKIAIAAILAATLCTAPVFASAQTVSAADETNIPAIPMGEKHPDFTVTTTDGEKFTLSETLKDKDAVVINYFMQQCGACEGEIPAFNALLNEYSDKVAFIGLDPAPDDTAEDIARVKADWSADMPMAIDEGGKVAKFTPFTGFPCTIVVDKLGEIVFYQDYSIGDEKAFGKVLDTITADSYQGGFKECNQFDVIMQQYLAEMGNASAAESAPAEAPAEQAAEAPAADGYKITVKDQNGDPVKDAYVNFCAEDKCRMEHTDENGQILIKEEPGKYHVQVLVVPEGYTAEGNTELYTDANTMEINLTVTKN